ncbi:MAG: hypothetical protein ACTHLR_17365 [Rhizomicrobium sp.]
MLNKLTDDPKKLARFFVNKKIPTEKIAFYNHPNFRKAEEQNPNILEFYAAWVRARPQDEAYLAHVRKVVPKITNALYEQTHADPASGACIDASMALTKMFELEGVWCYAARGSLEIRSKALSSATHFWYIDVHPTAGHVWVVAPPFEIIDLTLQKQLYTGGEASILPKTVILEDADPITPAVEDYCSPEFLQSSFGRSVHPEHDPRVAAALNAGDFFPSFEVGHEATKIRYALGGITASEADEISDIINRKWNGRSPAEIYKEFVSPLFR